MASFEMCSAGCVIAGAYFVRNPGKVMAKLITAANPNAEVLNVDDNSRQVRIRDKRDRRSSFGKCCGACSPSRKCRMSWRPRRQPSRWPPIC